MKQSHAKSGMRKIEGAQIVILQSKWYREQTDMMTSKCKDLLEGAGATTRVQVISGCLEFALVAKLLLRKVKLDAIVCIGILMKGETDHYEMILQSCVIGMQRVSLDEEVPLINAILPVYTLDQAKARSSNNESNKGIEAALAVGEFISWRRELV